MTVLTYLVCRCVSNDCSPEIRTWLVPEITCTVYGKFERNKESKILCIHLCDKYQRLCVIYKYMFRFVKVYDLLSCCTCGGYD